MNTKARSESKADGRKTKHVALSKSKVDVRKTKYVALSYSTIDVWKPNYVSLSSRKNYIRTTKMAAAKRTSKVVTGEMNCAAMIDSSKADFALLSIRLMSWNIGCFREWRTTTGKT